MLTNKYTQANNIDSHFNNMSLVIASTGVQYKHPHVLDVIRTTHTEIMKCVDSLIDENKTLDNNVMQMQVQISNLTTEVSELKQSCDKIQKSYDIIQKECDDNRHTISARKMAIDAERKAQDYILPNCRCKPYQLYTLKNLLEFLETANNQTQSKHPAKVAWSLLPEQQRCDIMLRKQYIEDAYPFLTSSICTIKECGNVIAHTVVQNTLEYFKNSAENVEYVEALEECDQFIKIVF